MAFFCFPRILSQGNAARSLCASTVSKPGFRKWPILASTANSIASWL